MQPKPAPGMSSAVRVAFVGLGGAGQRHARILRALLGSDTRWLGVRGRGTTPVLDATFRPQSTSMADAYGLDVVPTLSAALAAGVDLVVVATPTALHVDTASQALAAGCSVLVEKPLAASLQEAVGLAQLAEDRSVSLFVGFQRRFHPAWLETAEVAQSGRLGQLREVSMWARSNVATWHPYEALDGLYAVRRDLGGGVVRTECHELDQIVGLFGAPRRVQCESVTAPGPNAVEHSADMTLDYGDIESPVRLSVSFESLGPERGWRFVGSEGHLSWDEATGFLEVVDGDQLQRRRIVGYGNDDLVAAQDRWVLDRLTEPAAGRPGLAQAVTTSAVIEAAGRASWTKTSATIAIQ